MMSNDLDDMSAGRDIQCIWAFKDDPAEMRMQGLQVLRFDTVLC